MTISETRAQGPSTMQDKSGLRAFALNLLVPGLGQRYLHDGAWNGWAPIFTGADAALGLGLVGTIWYRNQQVEAYRTLAAGSAGANVENKDRAFFVQMAAYESQKRYIEDLLRSRQWAALEEAETSSRYWNWTSNRDWERYKNTRANADALTRRRTILITALIANRIISGITALLQAREDSSIPQAGVGIAPDGHGRLQHRVHLRFQW